jgi:CheY-like chemotaxis protein
MEALGTLTGGIAHDFNNILAAVVGFSELLLGSAAKGNRQEHYLHRVLEAGLRGRELVKQMLTFSRKTEQDKKPLHLSSVVKETMKLLRASIPATISVRTNVRDESGLVFADPTQMQQVLMNLCTNAAHAMQERGGILRVELSDSRVSESDKNPHDIKRGLYVKMAVHDTGTGISSDIVDKIFDPFFTTKERGEGTGLGLSVVHGIVKQHDGYITVKSEPGKGSIFSVYLPMFAEKHSIDAPSDDHIPTGEERVLFIEDEKALAELGREILRELGYHVTVRTSSAEALALFASDPSEFHLVITDQTMPEMTGVDLAKEILTIRADMPIIMCTGFSHAVDADKAKATGIKAFAMKPLTKREIAKTIRKVLDE